MRAFYRTYAEVDLTAIRHNISEVRRNIDSGTKIMAVIKANAYGHGAVQVAKAIDDLADAFGVAIAEEAMELREAEFHKEIIIFGYCQNAWFADLIKNNITLTVFTLDMAEQISRQAVALNKTAKVHIKVDTGMGRIGFEPTKEGALLVKRICELPGIDAEGVYTHFARADEKTTEAAELPLKRFKMFIGFLSELGIHIPNKHVSNSAGIINLRKANFDMVRCGISTYGVYPSDEISKDYLKLRPAMSWRAVISYVKKIPEGTPVSYGGTYIAEKETTVATVSIGYADGMKRDLSNKGRVLVKGQYAPILGRICMDQFMIDVTGIPDIKPGVEVTIFGKDGENEITVEEIAGIAHSFSYEFLCSVSARVPRRYKNS